jgi:hypothetical protein
MGDGHGRVDPDPHLEDDIASTERQLLIALKSRDRVVVREMLERMGRLHLSRDDPGRSSAQPNG